jgi:APA family basic amino acid/polyamine antiporter
LTAAAIVVVFTALHYLGQRLGGAVQNVLAAIKLGAILLLAGTGLVLASGGGMAWSSPTGGEFQFGSAMMMVMFAYSGWNASAYIAAEVRDPRRTLPRSLTIGTVIVIVLYLLVNLFIFAAAPYTELRGKVAVAEVAAVHAFGDWIPHLLNGLFAVSMLSSLGAFILIGPRVYYAMARDGLFFRSAASVHPKFGVPGAAIMIQGALALLMIFIGSFEQLLLYVGFALGIFPLLAVGGLFIARAERIGADTAAPVRWYPFLPVVFLVASILLMLIAFLDRPLESGLALLTAAAGVPVYFIWVRLAKKQ